MIPAPYRLASRLVRLLREAKQPASPEVLAAHLLAARRVPSSERFLREVLDGRFWQEGGRVGLWEWRYAFPPPGEPVVVLDLETTGLSPERDEIIEVALIRVEGARRLEYSRLVNPGRPIPPRITRLTGIRSGDVRDQPDVYTVLEEVVPLLEGATLVIQNAPFDLGFLRPRFAKLSVTIRNEVIDTVQWARRALPGMRRRSLDHLIEVFEVPKRSRHRAFEDAEATLAVAYELYYMLTAGKARALGEV
ncbi:3'-5' exonuclease [Marinithermus hydrothermalis]|uniref:DNA polymerase III, epsilon subunit n=1 Tax=Marinithermus hydrothermalis (strain DSM 14884 / JCM 11576 / T1) TaxID=869210 RepID=F2NL94_MARHT|nr:3'-5' exonuclease [Marinithermus hydrothermalis]AEB11713.1 DNA polymerase III, epsilon subunit [Marinithermus hydrothermalis DSM 14884]